MHDRLSSVKLSRTLRNISLALAVVLFLEFFILLLGSYLNNLPFITPTLIYLLLAFVFAWLAWYFHGRFRSRE
jgi:hypothetical protein